MFSIIARTELRFLSFLDLDPREFKQLGESANAVLSLS